MWDGLPFHGAKIALLADGMLLVYQRDDKPAIPSPGLWDLPGGGREGDETPFECARRETFEEFGLSITTDHIVWQRVYSSVSNPGARSHFFVAEVPISLFGDIQFGHEGQGWKVLAASEFLRMAEAVPSMKARLKDFYDRGSG